MPKRGKQFFYASGQVSWPTIGLVIAEGNGGFFLTNKIGAVILTNKLGNVRLTNKLGRRAA